MWGGRDIPPEKFLAELYGQECEEDDILGGEFEEVDPVEEAEIVEELEEPVEDDEENEPSSPVAPPYSPLTSPRSRRSRSRSRSPLVRVSPPPSPLNSVGVVIRVFDEDGVDFELARRNDEAAYVGGGEESEEFFTTDAHALYAGMMDERMDSVDESGMPDDRGATLYALRGAII